MSLGRAAKKFAHLREQDEFVYDEIFSTNAYGLEEKDVRNKVVLDLGANLGFFTVLCNYLGAKKVVAVEANPKIYVKFLENTKGMDKVKSFNVAVSDESNKVVKINDNGGESSLYFEEKYGFFEVNTLTVEALMCDPLEKDGDDIVLKLDVEGSEYDVLLNMPDQVFDRIKTVFVEIHSKMNPVHRGFEILMDKLREKGFHCVHKKALMNWFKASEDSEKVWEEGDQANFKFIRTVAIKASGLKVISDKPSVLCCISTKDRYFTTLPLAVSSVLNQTVLPNELVLFDDGEHRDLRNEELYVHIFKTLDSKRVKWKVNFGANIGQHHNHEQANKMGYDLVWRVDDDEVVEPDVLEKLLRHFKDPKVGAVGGSVITPGGETPGGSNRMIDILDTPNLQWSRGHGVFEVEHLYSSFLYRANKAHYCLELSPVAHREETIFSHELHQAGYKLLVDMSAVTWHYRSSTGGIRDHKDKTMFDWDERIFAKKMEEWGYKVLCLDCGIGDHYAFLHTLPHLMKRYDHLMLGCCYPEVFEDYRDRVKLLSIAQTANVVQGDNIYKWMIDNEWQKNLVEAFAAKYEVKL